MNECCESEPVPCSFCRWMEEDPKSFEQYLEDPDYWSRRPEEDPDYWSLRPEEEEEEQEEEDTFSCLKSPDTSGGCCYGSVPLWHQAANLVSKPLWVC